VFFFFFMNMTIISGESNGDSSGARRVIEQEAEWKLR